MHKGPGPKRKSQKRFEQLNHIVDNVVAKLPTRHTAALFVCFRHAREGGHFRLSVARLASTLGINRRTAQRLLHELEQWGVIRTVKPEQGTIPRCFQITGTIRRGDTQTAPSNKPTTRASGDKFDA